MQLELAFAFLLSYRAWMQRVPCYSCYLPEFLKGLNLWLGVFINWVSLALQDFKAQKVHEVHVNYLSFYKVFRVLKHRGPMLSMFLTWVSLRLQGFKAQGVPWVEGFKAHGVPWVEGFKAQGVPSVQVLTWVSLGLQGFEVHGIHDVHVSNLSLSFVAVF